MWVAAWSDDNVTMAGSESVQLILTVVGAFAALVAAGGTVWYAILTKRLWASTDANVALTKRMLERAPWEHAVDPVEGIVIHEPVESNTHLADGVDGFAGRTR